MFIHRTELTVTYLVIYVDDLLITGNDETQVQSLIQSMSAMFSLKRHG